MLKSIIFTLVAISFALFGTTGKAEAQISSGFGSTSSGFDDLDSFAPAFFGQMSSIQQSMSSPNILYMENIFTSAPDPMVTAGPIGDILGSMYHKDAHDGLGGLYGPGGQFENSWGAFEAFTLSTQGVYGMEFLARTNSVVDGCNSGSACPYSPFGPDNPGWDHAGTSIGFGCGLGAIVAGAPTGGAGAVIVLVICTGAGVGTQMYVDDWRDNSQVVISP